MISGNAFSQDLTKGDVATAALAARASGTQTIPKGIDKGWYAKAIANLEEREYYMRTLDKPGVYGAVNRIQHLGYMFTKGGYCVKNFNEDGSTKDLWEARFLLAGIGRKDQIHEKNLLRAQQTGELSLRYDYGDYAVAYDNEKQGMEQSFRITKKPAGKTALQVVMNLNGDLWARTDAQGQLLLYTPGHPEDVKLVYGQLQVWDKNRKSLPAHIQISDAHRLVLTVDDSRATYPVTIDPLNHTPNWSSGGSIGILGQVELLPSPYLYGFSVAAAGKINNATFGDIIIGAPTFTKILSISSSTITFTVGTVGAAFIYYGGITGPATVASRVLQPSGAVINALFGYSVSTAGDVDGDGKADVVIGAPGDVVNLGVFGNKTIGRVYVYKGSTITAANVNTVASTPDVTLGLGSGDILDIGSINPLYGFSVSSAGDVNGDGHGDIIVGCPFCNVLSGRVDIYQGTGNATALPSTPTTKIEGTLGSGAFGFSVSAAGDVNGDNVGDVIVGAPGFVNLTAIGHAYVFQGHSAIGAGITATLANNAATTITAPAPLIPGALGYPTLFGFSVSTAGDVNKDGKSDVIIGEPLALEVSGLSVVLSGRAYVYYSSGALGIQTTGFTTISSPRSIARIGLTGNLLFGYSVSAAGDLNGDGAGDLVIGEPGSKAAGNISVGFASLLGTLNTTAVLSGQVYIFLGNGAGGAIANNPLPSWTLTDPTAALPNLLGASVALAGDVDGDGHPDILIGSPSGVLDLGFSLSTLLSSLTTGSGLITSGSLGSAYFFSGIGIVLPVTLINFTGTPKNGEVLLDWSTAMEENSSHFEIDRSSDNVNFSSIGNVAAAGNSNQQLNYSFTDPSPVSGNNYYRLKMVDLDGSFVYSQVVVVNFSSTMSNVIAVYPNPAHESFQLQFRNMQQGQYVMTLLSPTGQLIQAKTIQVGNSANYVENVLLNTGLAQGAYIIRVVDAQQRSYITRIMIQ